jgi:peptidoglycan/xylan/chitin deacetylase (PgdA/CDA1 family)
MDLSGHDAKVEAYLLFESYIARNVPKLKSVAKLLLPTHEVSDEALVREHFMSWEELRGIVSHPLITVGAHTVRHDALSALDENDALAEMTTSRQRLQDKLQRSIDHFAYPFGTVSTCGPREFVLAQRAGFRTAVTTRPGNISKRHLEFPTALPRFVLGGAREKLADVSLCVSGAMNRFVTA